MSRPSIVSPMLIRPGLQHLHVSLPRRLWRTRGRITRTLHYQLVNVVDPQHTPGVFLPAPPIPGAVVFNIGDFLMRWSNDELKSTLHRVRAPTRKSPEDTMTPERFSIPYVRPESQP